VFFHLGIFKNGYLGVDVFFVISGYLICNICISETQSNGYFSILNFYERRIRRILPLVLCVLSLALVLGLLFMMPSDLENLCQSILATLAFFNNYLSFITTKDYWALANELRPLMHTWSLGIEEQFYVVFPILFWFFSKFKRPYFGMILGFLVLTSFVFYMKEGYLFRRFYLIHFRFYEIGIGALLAFLPAFLTRPFVKYLSIFVFLFLGSFFFYSPLDSAYLTPALVLVTALFIGLNQVSSGSLVFWEKNSILSMRPMVFIGKLSFGLYMWHQLVLAFWRYVFGFENKGLDISLFFLLCFVLAYSSYRFIEQPCRDKYQWKIQSLFKVGIPLYVFLGILSLFIFLKGGLIKAEPSLDLKPKSLYDFSFESRESFSAYNQSVNNYGNSFDKNEKRKKIIILGDSFARDLFHVFDSLKINNLVSYRYLDFRDYRDSIRIRKMFKEAYRVYFCTRVSINNAFYENYLKQYQIEKSKTRIIGPKDFGPGPGRAFNSLRWSDNTNCHQFSVEVKKGIIKQNSELSLLYPKNYVNILPYILKENNEVQIVDEHCKILSHDGSHLTPAGARYLAKKTRALWLRDLEL
jgi:peptidoglycan/LPS O-acetylase OafA/YrhL